MRLDPKDKLFGQPILEVRAVVKAAMKRLLWGDTKSELEMKIAKRLKKSRAIACKVMEGLIDENYLILEKKTDDNEIYYNLAETEKGFGFGMASANPPISRQKADLLLAEIIEKAKRVNGSKEYLYRVETLKVFGSYLTDKEILGDLDVAVKVSPKLEGEAFVEANFKHVAAAKKNGRAFQSFFQEIEWPYKEVIQMLKTRKKGLSLHDEDSDEVVRLTETRTVYTFKPS
ncbi:hypothetical protein G3O08_04705 [Cryomorpha ignava]|uniref:Uncharacterized protein n=1 Tax=Cryomorpha ignava TaxID=101383 RepID=A0A7K3WMC9_9FLAO|nr:hypothetical protein [Cryomorpha ignava]NEN22799.1 hypothetical protein [Cryomorpha ignava]